MAPTTLTSIVMVAFALVVLTMAGYAWFGSWQPEPRRRPEPYNPEHEAAVEQMRLAIEAYERGERSL